MSRLSLTKIIADELALAGIVTGLSEPALGRPRRTVFSPEIPGFGLRHYASDRAIYILQTQMGGRSRTLTIGNAAVLPERVARDVARRALLRAEVGENPADTRARIRAAPSWERFLDEYWKRIGPRWKPTTLVSHDAYRRSHVQAAFAGRFIDELEQGDVAKWFARVTVTGGPGAANRCLEIIRTAFNKAEQWGYRTENTNPCLGVRRNRPGKRDRYLTVAELGRLGKALDAAAETQPMHAAAVRLLLLSGCRRSEIVLLKWSEVRGSRLLLTDSKTGPRTVWLGASARAVLDAQPRARGQQRVFPFTLKTERSAVDYFWHCICSDAGLTKVRLHDLRHTYASHATQNAEGMVTIARLLGHGRVSSTARYAHLDDASVLDAAALIGAEIERQSLGRP